MKNYISPESLMEALSSRYATKQFDPAKRIWDAEWQALLESLRLSPSSFGLQPWQFVVVQDPLVRKRLRSVAWNQSQVEDASHFVVFTTLKQVDESHVKKYIESTASIRNIPTESLKGYEDMMMNAVVQGSFNHLEWTRRQAYIAMGFLGLSAAMLGIDTCMLEGLDTREFDKILGMENGKYTTVAAAAVGYRSDTDGTSNYKKSRFPMEEVVRVV